MPQKGTREPREWSTVDPNDSQEPYVDIEQVKVRDPRDTTDWMLHLREAPPRPTEVDSSCTVISYGLTFDTNRDGEADYVVGISTAAPPRPAGNLRVWVTNLGTGETTEQIGPPYGYPIDFYYPGVPAGRTMWFLFRSYAPGGIDYETNFYAWASVEKDGNVVAWDYAPDAAWLSTISR